MASSSLKLGKIAPLGGSSAPKSLAKPPPPLDAGFRPEAGFRRETTSPRGPQILGLGRRRDVGGGGPGNPPQEFKSPSTSAVEWYWYWGSYVVLDLGDPRRPPYTGDGVIMSYQVPDDPSDVRAAVTGVSDFVYHLPYGDVIVRIDTYYYHIASGPAQLARDAYLKLHGNSAEQIVISAWDDEIIGDPSGRAVCAAVARALSSKESISRTKSGLAYPPVDLIAVAP